MAVAIWWAAGAVIDGPAEDNVLSGFDRPTLRFLVENRTDFLTTIMKKVTFLGGSLVTIVGLAGAAVTAYAMTRMVKWPTFFVGVLVGGTQLSSIVKELVDRPRPTMAPLLDLGTDAFPSGHATSAAACFLGIAYFASLRWKRAALPIWTAAALGVAAVALSRVYLGVHWSTDVLAGAGLGAFWVGVMARALASRRREPA